MAKLASEANVKRTASAPNAGMPFGKWLFTYFWMRSLCSLFSRPAVDFSNNFSYETPSMRSSGSNVLPFDFDIFSPSASRTMALMYTWRNGTLPVKWRVAMIMRATQKKMMSLPVTSTSEGRKVSRSGVLSGQPRELNGTSWDENQVSRTSGSLFKTFPFACLLASSSLRATYSLPSSSYHAGIWWPHQS